MTKIHLELKDDDPVGEIHQEVVNNEPQMVVDRLARARSFPLRLRDDHVYP